MTKGEQARLTAWRWKVCSRRLTTSMMHNARKADRLDSMEIYIRLGLRMQNQCRATAETLATMKMPPVFAKNYQANIANGPQQVNNGSPAREEWREIRPNELLEAPIEPERMDSGKARTATDGYSLVAAVDTVNRAKNSPRKSAGRSQRRSRRDSAAAASYEA